MNKFSVICGLSLLLTLSCSSNTVKDKTPEERKADVYYGQGTSELVNKEYNKALINLLKAKELAPKDSLIRTNLGMAYYFKNQIPLAEQELKEAISLDSKNSDARVNLGNLYMAKNKIKEAREQFEKVTMDLTYTNQYRNFYNLALLSLKEGDRRGAFEFLEKSLKEREDYCAAHFKMGELYSEEFQFQKALKSFREAGKGTCVSEPAPLYQQAITLLNLNKNTEAQLKLKEVMEKFPGTRFSTLANMQLKKMNDQDQAVDQQLSKQTEVIKESSEIETPSF